MGLLDYLVKLDQRLMENPSRAENAVELERLNTAEQRQAIGLAQALAGVGKGPQAPVQQPDGRFKTPMDPNAAAAVRLMQNPGSRGIGNLNAINVMDPAWQQQQATNKQAIDMNALQIEGQGYANTVGKLRAAYEPQNIENQKAQANYAASQDRRQGAESTQQQQINRMAIDAAGKALQFNPGPPIPAGYIGSVIEQGTLANNARESGGAARTLANIWSSAGTLDSMKNPEIKGTAIYAAMGTVPILQQILTSGTLNEGELETFTGLIGDLSNPESAWRRISTRDDGVIKLLNSLADRSDRNLAAIKRGPVGMYINAETLTPMTPAWQPPPGFVPLDMPVTADGQFQNQGTGVDPGRARNAMGEMLLEAAKGLPGVLDKGFSRRGP